MQKLDCELDCGCVLGYYLCPEAQHLRDMVSMAYRQALVTGKWNEYEKWRRVYHRHICYSESEGQL